MAQVVQSLASSHLQSFHYGCGYFWYSIFDPDWRAAERAFTGYLEGIPHFRQFHLCTQGLKHKPCIRGQVASIYLKLHIWEFCVLSLSRPPQRLWPRQRIYPMNKIFFKKHGCGATGKNMKATLVSFQRKGAVQMKQSQQTRTGGPVPVYVDA